MVKLFLRIVLVLLAIVGIFAAIGFVLPRSYSTNAEVTIDAPIEVVFAEVNTMKKWSSWSSWDPDRIKGLKVTFEGEESGQGAVMKWEDPRPDKRFDGVMEIIKSTDNDRIEYHSKIGQIPMDGYFEFTANGKNSTTVKWVAAGKLPSGTFYGWYGLVYNGFLGTELNNSLNRLKKNLEGRSGESKKQK